MLIDWLWYLDFDTKFLFYFSFIQPQTVGHHRNTAEGHGQGGQNGVQLPQHDRQGLERVENSGGDRNQNDIVAKGPKEILLDGRHGGAAQPDRPRHTF